MMNAPIRIVGIDPGLRATGWGVVAIKGNALSFLAAGTIKAPVDGELAARLIVLHAGLAEILRSMATGRGGGGAELRQPRCARRR